MTDPLAATHKTAIVVDDHNLIRAHACEILEDAGYQALEAQHADEALALLERHHEDVDLLFTDVEMPGSRDGFALAREVASRYAKIAIIIASGEIKPKPDDIPDGARFIQKPFSAEIVHDHLRDMLPKPAQPRPLKER